MEPELIGVYRCGGVRVKLYQCQNGKYKAEIFERYHRKPSHVLTGIRCMGTLHDVVLSTMSFVDARCCDDDSPCAGDEHKAPLDWGYDARGDYRVVTA